MNEAMPRHVQTQLPAGIHRRLRDLSYESRRSVSSLLVDAVLLLLRYHGAGSDLPAPLAPTGEVSR